MEIGEVSSGYILQTYDGVDVDNLRSLAINMGPQLLSGAFETIQVPEGESIQ